MTTLDLQQLLTGIIINHSFGLSADKDAKEDKQSITLNADFDFSGITIAEGLQKAVGQATIAWQQANRPSFDNFTDGQKLGTIEVGAAGRKAPVDSEKVVANRYAAADFDERVAQLVRITGMDELNAKAIVSQQEANQNS